MTKKRSASSADSSSSDKKRNRQENPPSSTENASISLNASNSVPEGKSKVQLSQSGLSFPPAPLTSNTPSNVPPPLTSISSSSNTNRTMDEADKTGSMAQEQTKHFCKNSACMFFGSSNTEGYCSVCYKDYVKKRNQPPEPSSSSPGVSNSIPMVPSAMDTVKKDTSKLLGTATAPVPILSPSINISNLDASPAGSPASSLAQIPNTASSPGRTKKRRCGVCKKKVGLTGMECRCGNLYCNQHRYASDHECTFDYQSSGRAQLRKDNPVVQDLKVNKI